MRAYFCPSYGPPEVLEQRDIPKPGPTGNDILVKVKAVPITVGDCRVRAFRVPPSYRFLAKVALGFRRPRKPILGRYFAGTVDAVGEQATQFKVGDRVFGSMGNRMGIYAEYVCLSESGFVGGDTEIDTEIISFIKERIEHNEIRPFIDSTYAFNEMVKAHRRAVRSLPAPSSCRHP